VIVKVKVEVIFCSRVFCIDAILVQVQLLGVEGLVSIYLILVQAFQNFVILLTQVKISELGSGDIDLDPFKRLVFAARKEFVVRRQFVTHHLYLIPVFIVRFLTHIPQGFSTGNKIDEVLGRVIRVH